MADIDVKFMKMSKEARFEMSKEESSMMRSLSETDRFVQTASNMIVITPAKKVEEE